MPGTKDVKAPSLWFKKAFGFKEASFEATRSRFSFADDTLSLNGCNQSFYVGPFDVLPLEELQARLASFGESGNLPFAAGPLRFHNIKASSSELHTDPEHAGAVFQVASLFNCLELACPDTQPEEGVTQGGCQPTQGSACASACPAATVFRNYFVNGAGQANGKQIDCLSEVSKIMGNGREHYWTMRNGFCMPTQDFPRINRRFDNEAGVDVDIRNKLQVGIHWDTEVVGGAHRVAQVFCSAAPVSLSKFVRADDWEQFARCILEAEFEATLTAAAILAQQRGARVQVFLTPVGGGLLGNRVRWVVEAMDRAMTLFKDAPLDVCLVHMSFPFNVAYKRLEKDRSPAKRRSTRRSVSEDMQRLGGELHDLHDEEEIAEQESQELEHARRIAKTFAFFDQNGDGIIDRNEFMDILMMLDTYFFTVDTVDTMLAQADADGDGEVHYVEFAAWLTGAACDAVVRNLFAASLAKTGEVDFSVTQRQTAESDDLLHIEPPSELHMQGRRSSNAQKPNHVPVCFQDC